MAARNFGFETHLCRQIDLDRVDSALANELARVVNAWSACINCGSCAATCPAGQNGDLNFRKLHYKIRLGLPVEKENYLSLQSCLLCGKCQLVCPRGIPTRYLAIQIMQMTNPIPHVAEGIPSV